MQITNTKTGDLEAKLKVEISPDDYKENFNKALKSYKAKINLPGFRKGKAPAGIIRKRFGESIMAEEVDKLLQDGISNYLENEFDQKIFGRPLPINDPAELKLDMEEELVFEYELGIQPTIDLGFVEEDKLSKFKIDLNKKDLDKLILDYRKRNYESPEIDEAEKDDLLSLELLPEQKDFLLSGEKAKGFAYIKLSDLKGKDLQKELLGAGKDIQVKASGSDIYDNIEELAKAFQKKAEELNSNALENSMDVKVLNVAREGISELNEDFFKKAFGEEEVKNEEEFRTKYKDVVEHQLGHDAENLLVKEAIDHMFKEARFELPENFLRRLFSASADSEEEKEHANEHFAENIEYLRKEIIVDQLLEDIGEEKIEYNDLLEVEKEDINAYLMQMGMPAGSFPEDRLNEMAVERLKEEKAWRNALTNVKNKRLVSYFKANVKFVEKEIAYDDFLKLIEAQNVEQ